LSRNKGFYAIGFPGNCWKNKFATNILIDILQWL